jgi:hypothetical protein
LFAQGGAQDRGIRADRAPYSHLAAELVMSPSQVHASVRRAEGSQSG